MSSFSQQLDYGKAGESRIANYFKGRGYSVLPIYEKEMTEYKGPTLFAFDSSSVIAPDMLVFSQDNCFWIEAKRKSAFTWHRITQRWVTGIDLHHYEEYLKIADKYSPWPVWLFFLHEAGEAKDTPPGMTSPVGLYANDINVLRHNENHRHKNWGKHGMVYWAVDNLKHIKMD
jgi:hypothetical protein